MSSAVSSPRVPAGGTRRIALLLLGWLCGCTYRPPESPVELVVRAGRVDEDRVSGSLRLGGIEHPDLTVYRREGRYVLDFREYWSEGYQIGFAEGDRPAEVGVDLTDVTDAVRLGEEPRRSRFEVRESVLLRDLGSTRWEAVLVAESLTDRSGQPLEIGFWVQLDDPPNR